MIHITKSWRTVRHTVTLLAILTGFLTSFYVLHEHHDRQTPKVDALSSNTSISDGFSSSLSIPLPVNRANRRSGSWCPGPPDSDEDHYRHDCQPALEGKKGPRYRQTIIAPEEYLERAKNCGCFRSDLGYFVSPEDTTDDERRFPIAFSLLTYENMEQTERLLRLIYRPHNVYCIHVDAKSPTEFSRGLKAIANCFDNVFIAHPPVDVNWGKVSIVDAEILCMRQLLKYSGWKYFINLVGRDFPLRTNLELVKILSAYNGSNDVDGSRRMIRYV